MDDKGGDNLLKRLWRSSQLSGANAAYLESLYEGYLHDPDSVGAAWRRFFHDLPRQGSVAKEVEHGPIREAFRRPRRRFSVTPASIAKAPPTGGDATERADHAASAAVKQAQIGQLIDSYRLHGHLKAQFNPLGRVIEHDLSELLPGFHGLGEADAERVFDLEFAGVKGATLVEVIDRLERIYCGPLGVEYWHVSEREEREWLQARIEREAADFRPDETVKRRLLEQLTAAEGLEHYLHRKYVGQKRFSLEGAEALIPMLEELIQRGGSQGLQEIVIGMAHRGRINVLINIMGKQPAELFLEFEGKKVAEGEGSGDVKYHLGFSSNIRTAGGVVHVSLAFNPSHLEIVSPVVEGSVRARQVRRDDRDGSLVAPILIHGDAAFAGQGVVMETFNMSQSRGYSTKGTIHIVINNQIGFTTSNQKDARSTLYCTDVAKLVNAPIFHVNGDDPEAVLYAVQVALDYRMRFRKDVVIDLVCYRRHGHSEADEPSVTQPLMYATIKQKMTPRDLYARRLMTEGLLTEEEAGRVVEEYYRALDKGACVVPGLVASDQVVDFGLVDWKPYLAANGESRVDTAIDLDLLQELAAQLGELPEGFELHPSVAKVFDNRRKMAAGGLPIDWGFAETMAYASLLRDGYGVRLSGQDSGRGTFFHRHATVYNQVDDSVYVPLRSLENGRANFIVTNSLLSEEAVLAFEYGYATTDPRTLVIWEAQFGDFANNAQVVIDQFISAGEQKWNRMCGLTMFLPHGYEGQGPEHSSARLERYLQLCAEHNMQVCVPTTPAQVFHMLRQHMLGLQRKPLIVMTPKSLLRHREAVSTLDELLGDRFKPVIPSVDDHDPDGIRRFIMCSGKVYYDLLEKKRSENREDVVLVRLEQLYPFPKEELRTEIEKYANVEKYIWCQEEPKNQGAWYSSQHHIRALLAREDMLEYAGRPPSAAPAVGYPILHIQQLCTLLEDALGPFA